MAIIDAKMELMDAASIAGTAAAVVSMGNYIDLGTAVSEWGDSVNQNIGEGGHLWVNCRVNTAIDCAGLHDPKYTFKLYSHTTSTVASGTLLISQGCIATVVGQTVLRQKLPAGKISRYLGGTILVGASTIASGALDAWISLDTESDVPIR